VNYFYLKRGSRPSHSNRKGQRVRVYSDTGANGEGTALGQKRFLVHRLDYTNVANGIDHNGAPDAMFRS
jgi:hypothetical protein